VKVDTIDLSKFNQAATILEKIHEHRKRNPTTRSEELYYELMAKHFREILAAEDAGKPFIYYSMGIPNEIFEAMGIVAMEYDMAAGAIASVLKAHEEGTDAASKLGIKPEICSAQLLPIGFFSKGWFPRPAALIYTNLSLCDNVSKNGHLLGELYDIPTFFVDRPYYWWYDRGVEYMTGELEDLVYFLEEHTKRKLDYDKLNEANKLSMEQVKLIREIHALGMATPCPMRARAATQAHWLYWLYAGRQEGINYFETFRDELKELVDQKKGVATEEKFRLISLFTPPQHQMKVLDWLENERCAAIVSEPYYFRWEEWIPDPSKPLESLARKYYHEPYYRWYGKLSESLDMAVNDALESKANGAVNWFNSKCRMGGAVAKIMKDTLKEKVGIPTLTFDLDMLDPSSATEKALKEALEEFLAVLALTQGGNKN